MKKRVLETLRARPLNKSELARALEVPPDERAAFREILRDLEKAGTIVRGKKGRYNLPQRDNRVLPGVFVRGARGVRLRDHDPRFVDGLVPLVSRHPHTALDGDEVLVRIDSPNPRPLWLKKIPASKRAAIQARLDEDQRPLGRITRILKRAGKPIVGTLRQQGPFHTLVPDDPACPKINIIEPGPANPGDKITAALTDWPSARSRAQGKVLEVLGRADDPGVDILALIRRHDLRSEFPREVIDEAEVAAHRTEDNLEQREDWRDFDVITIDPFDARDFDDAISVKELDSGGWELAVHIADVSHFVRPGMALDKEARRRGNSVYLVDRVLPMLPEVLSNGVCSLRPDEERLTFAVIMEFDRDGVRRGQRFTSAVIQSKYRLSYEEAYEKMQGSPSGDSVARHLHCAWDLASRLRAKRMCEGSLDLGFPEIKVILDEMGRPTELRRVDYDESHQLIEEFMLAANETVAEHVRQASRPSIYRIHEEPDPEKLDHFADLVRAHGHAAGDLTLRGEIRKVLRSVRGTPEEHALQLALLKSLKRAAYTAEPLGHYGLAKDNYTHFTSPIRRYADLVVHRVLRRILEDTGKTPAQVVMSEIGQHLSATERQAAEAEEESKRLKIIEYLDGLLQSDPERSFGAVVYDVGRLGLFVELPDFQVRGVVRMEDMPDDRYRFLRTELRLIGRHSRSEWRPGDRLVVRLTSVDRKKQWINFEVVERS